MQSKLTVICTLGIVLLFGKPVRGQVTAFHDFTDVSPHNSKMIRVESGVELEVLDWGGSGRPLILLAGLGGTAHTFDAFAVKLTGKYHVYAITRRGFGKSSSPSTGYSADRLGDDVLAVIDSLHLNKPVLAGHSLAGEELSSIGSRHPGKVAGLIYLDAGYPYAFYDESRGDFNTDLADFQERLARVEDPTTMDKKSVQAVLETLPALERALRNRLKDIEATPPSTSAAPPPVFGSLASRAVIAGQRKYTNIPVPVLAIFAVPHLVYGPMPEAQRAALEASDEAITGAQASAFEHGVPTARVVRLAHADHFVFQSNEADVIREMNGFIGGLP